MPIPCDFSSLLFADTQSLTAVKEMASLSSQNLTWLFVGQLVFGAVLAIACAYAMKDKLLQLFDPERGKLVLQIITIFFICTIVGNLTLMKILDPAAAAGLFGAVLGYVFGAGQKADKT